MKRQGKALGNASARHKKVMFADLLPKCHWGNKAIAKQNTLARAG